MNIPQNILQAVARAEKAEAKAAELQAWKDSAMEVEREWDAQAIAKSLGAIPGQSCRRVIAKRVPELLAELSALKSAQLGILRLPDAEATQPSAARKVTGQHGPKGSPNLCGPSMPVDPEPAAQVPLGPEDVPPGSVFRNAEVCWYNVKYVLDNCVCIDINGRNTLYYQDLKTERWQINTSIPDTGHWDANAWRPCSKPAGKEVAK